MDSGDTAWILTSTALVLLMTPGLALFYGGMVRAKSVLNMMMMSLGAMAVVGILWVLYGYSIAYGTSIGGVLGNPGQWAGLRGALSPDALVGTVPVSADVAFQAVFAIITVALISGAIAERARFGPWLVFVVLWATIVYFPVAHWVWGEGGWIGEIGTLDFAGGTAVHINSGAAALALALVLGKRIGWPRDVGKPHNLPFVVLGAALLWFGWFGFNAGSAYAADSVAGVAVVNTLVATCGALLAWLLVERIRFGKATTLGAASGIVAGLVAITPAADSVTPIGAITVGVVAGALCALAVSLKFRLGFDDSLDVVGIHLVGGLVGTVMIGFVASASAPAGVDGLFYGGGAGQLGVQAVGALGVLVYSFVLALVLGFLVKVVFGFRADPEAETEGIDEAEHAEAAYELTPLRGGSSPLSGGGVPASPTATVRKADR